MARWEGVANGVHFSPAVGMRPDKRGVPPSLSLSLSILIPSHNRRIEIRPINNPTVASKYSNERKSHIFLTLIQKIEMIKFSEEYMVKADIG